METLKNRVKRIIFEQCNGSNKEFAKLIGVGLSTINLWDDNHIPKGDILQRLHTVLNVDLHWFLTGKGDPCIEKSRSGKPQVSGSSASEAETRNRKVSDGRDFPFNFSPDGDPRRQQPTGLDQVKELPSQFVASGEQTMQAFFSNFQAFYHRMERHTLLLDRINCLERDCDELRQKIVELEGILGTNGKMVGS